MSNAAREDRDEGNDTKTEVYVRVRNNRRRHMAVLGRFVAPPC